MSAGVSGTGRAFRPEAPRAGDEAAVDGVAAVAPAASAGTGAMGDEASADNTVTALTDVLVRALRDLGTSGRPVRASRLAARAWWSLRDRWPAQAEHVNGVMHYLARLPAEPDQEGTPMSTPESDRTLDVRAEPPARRHTLIFETYGDLAPGTAFELVNDHDPKPLYYQFEAEHTGEFSWDYLEQGPEVWRVRIGRPAA